MRIILMGIQGSGKSTQGNLLAKKLGVPYLSSGHIFREMAKEKTRWGRYVKETINAGFLIPDKKVVPIIKDYLAKPEYNNGYILDGFPRTLYQAKHFKEKIDKVFYLKVSDKEALWRLAYRNDLLREDETVAAIRKRIELYHKLTEPVLTYYRRKGVLEEINGEAPIAKVHQEIMARLKVPLPKKILQIAIDGPVASGKGTVASIIAKRLGILYVYSGAMYRALALLALKNKINLKDEKKVLTLLKRSKIEFRKPKKDNPFGYSIFLDGKEVTWEIRNPEVSWGSSVVATLPSVRKILGQRQQEMAKGKSVIMEGRDITTRVLPNANLKIFLTANLFERARRRKRQLEKEQGIKKSLKEIIREIKKRDRQDSQRKVDPLIITPDAWVVDTTHLTISQVVEKILEKLKEKNLL